MTVEEGNGSEATLVHLLVLLVVSVGFEFAFLGSNLNMVDEGWPLYAAMQLHQGGTLYEDVFFVFPPGHLLMAYLAHWIDPPGVIAARILYALLNVSLVISLYFVGRRLMPAHYALFGCLLLAIGAETAHRQQLLFGYRYLVIAAMALLLFARHLDTGSRRLLFASGMMTGLGLCFRLTPAFSVAFAVGVGLLASTRSPRTWFVAGASYAAGLALVVLPAIGWLLVDRDAATLWREIVVRPIAMTDLQSLPVPDLGLHPVEMTRNSIHYWWVAIQFRTWTLLYIGYVLGVGWTWLTDLRAGRPYRDPFFATFVAFGAMFFMRSFGRSDGPHLYSALPPICLLLAHAGWLVFREAKGRALLPRAALAPAAVASLASWIFLMGSDRIVSAEHMGTIPLASLGGNVRVTEAANLKRIDHHVARLRKWVDPGETILDLSASSLFHVLSGLPGPGYADIVMPGTFLDADEERAFVARLEAAPPTVVVFPGWRFDDRADRAVQAASPLLWKWVAERYERIGPYERFVLFLDKRKLDRLERTRQR